MLFFEVIYICIWHHELDCLREHSSFYQYLILGSDNATPPCSPSPSYTPLWEPRNFAFAKVFIQSLFCLGLFLILSISYFLNHLLCLQLLPVQNLFRKEYFLFHFVSNYLVPCFYHFGASNPFGLGNFHVFIILALQTFSVGACPVAGSLCFRVKLIVSGSEELAFKMVCFLFVSLFSTYTVVVVYTVLQRTFVIWVKTTGPNI